MKIVTTKRSDYGIRAMICLAGSDGGPLTAATIAEEMEIPRGFLPQVLQVLQRGGLVRSTPGRGGGYALDRDPAGVSMLEILETLEGPLQRGECSLRGGPCRWEDVCALHEVWVAGRDALCAELAAATLADVAGIDAKLKDGSYDVPADSHRLPS